jgi:hypothetical protein
MTRTRILVALAVLAHIGWVATYDTGLGNLMGFVFIVLVAAAVLPHAARAVRRVRGSGSGSA